MAKYHADDCQTEEIPPVAMPADVQPTEQTAAETAGDTPFDKADKAKKTKASGERISSWNRRYRLTKRTVNQMEKHNIYQKELPHRAVTVYVYLADRTNRQGECWPAISTIARDLKLSPSTVRRALRDLRKAGVIESEQRYRDNGGKSSLLYKLDAQ